MNYPSVSRRLRRKVEGLTWKGLRIREELLLERLRVLEGTKAKLEAELAIVKARRALKPPPFGTAGTT